MTEKLESQASSPYAWKHICTRVLDSIGEKKCEICYFLLTYIYIEVIKTAAVVRRFS